MSHTSFTDLFSRVRSRSSFERMRPAPTLRPSFERKRSSSYSSYNVHQQEMVPAILRQGDIAKRILDHLAELPNGKRAVAKVARSCKALSEPAMDALWKDLDSLAPLFGLFPAKIQKRVKRPALGLSKTPTEADWERVLFYADRVQKVTFNESANSVSSSIFTIIPMAPRQHLFPNLKTLVWRCETAAGLERSLMLMSSKLESFTLEASRITRFEQFLAEMAKRTKLTSLSLTSTTAIPTNFPDVMEGQDRIQNLVFVIPGALTPAMGRWMAKLPKLKGLQLDITARSTHSIQSFFEETGLRSGWSTPTSFGATDSGVFTGSEDVEDVRKDLRRAALKLTGDYQSVASRTSAESFATLEDLQLTGDAGGAAVFLKHLRNPLVNLSLVIEDPPDHHDWQDLCAVISERFGDSLESLRVTTNTPLRPESTRLSSKSDGFAGSSLSLKHLSDLTSLKRLDIDLPYSYQFDAADIQSLAAACPAVEIIKLCPMARFSLAMGAPKLSLEDLAPLTANCRKLHSLSVVVSAMRLTDAVLESRDSSSTSLRHLHLGHSWVKEPFDTAIVLSHLAPHLEALRYFHESTRPGVIVAHAQNWLRVNELLPQLQRIRLAERRATEELVASRSPQPQRPMVHTVFKSMKSLKSARSVLESILESEGDEDSSIFIYPSSHVQDDQSSVFIYGPQTPVNYLAPQLPTPALRSQPLVEEEPEQDVQPYTPPVVKCDVAIDATVPEVKPVIRERLESWVQVETPPKFYSTINTSVTDLLPPPPPERVHVESSIQAVPETAVASAYTFIEVATASVDATPAMHEKEIEQDPELMEKPPLPPLSAEMSVQAMPEMVSTSATASPAVSTISVDATPKMISTSTETYISWSTASIDATPKVVHKTVGRSVSVSSTSVDATPTTVEKEVESMPALPERIPTPPPPRSMVDKEVESMPTPERRPTPPPSSLPFPRRSMSEKEIDNIIGFEGRTSTPPPVPLHQQRLVWPARERTMSTSTDATVVEPIVPKFVKIARPPSILSSSPPPKQHVAFEPEEVPSKPTGPSSYIPSVSGVTGAARELLVVYPTYLSLLAVHTALGMMGAKEPEERKRERTMSALDEMGIPSVCL